MANIGNWTTSTSNSSDNPYITWVQSTAGPIIGIEKREIGVKEKENGQMRSLYRVFAVDFENDEVVAESDLIVAGDAESAKFRAVRGFTELDDDLERYDFIVERVGPAGSIRPRREVQEMRVVE